MTSGNLTGHAPDPALAVAAPAPIQPAAAATVRPSKFPKQAIIVVHGMGEQRPMDTVKSFVETVWQLDSNSCANGMPNPSEVWSKPDGRSGSLELRRITTRESAPSQGVYESGVRNDFWELYWADLTAGTPWEEFRSWLWTLLLRNPCTSVPQSVILAWILLWVVTLIFGLAGMVAIFPTEWNIFGEWRWLVLAAIGAFVSGIHFLVQQTFGRVARYTRAAPSNIAARKAVRERGLELLEALHNDPTYVRIIIVSHSLGTIVAYELLAAFWAKQSGAKQVEEGTPAFEALCRLEQLADQLEREPKNNELRTQWMVAQRALRLELAGRPKSNERWIISDFVTLGSPLTHAEFLMAKDKDDLTVRKRSREMPTSPPWREVLDPGNLEAAIAAGLPLADPPAATRLFCFPLLRDKKWELHHAAPFAVVRWSNIFDPSRAIFFGDLISGPLLEVFGAGIDDVNLKSVRGKRVWRFTHLDYWKKSADKRQLVALRKAVNILDLPPSSLNYYSSKEML